VNPELLGPIFGAAALVISGIISGLWVAHNRRQGNRETRMPTLREAYAEMDRARDEMHFWQDLYYTARGLLRGLIRRLRDTHPDFELTPEELAALQDHPKFESKEKI
jgi:hypothetical protein